MMKVFTMIVILSLAFGVEAQAQSLEINGYARTYLGILTNATNDYSINQNTLDLKIKHTSDNVALFANTYIYQYQNRELESGVREIYMDIYFDQLDLRIGQQQIIWGKADGMFITDIVSPKDLGEFLLRDFDEIRTGVTSLKADYYTGDHTIEVVWIPAFTPTIQPDAASIWFPTSTLTLPVTVDDSKKEIPGRLNYSEGFIKYSSVSSILDFEIMGGTMWDDDPTMHISPVVESGNPIPVRLMLTPQHHKLTVGGGSFSSEIGGLIVRGEGAFYRGKQFAATNAAGFPIDLMEKNYGHYLIGIDFSIGSTRLSAQYTQRIILDYENPIVQDERENTMTVMANHSFLKETLALQLFAYVGLNNQDALVRPVLTYDFADGFEILVGANVFIKNDVSYDPGLFGQYDANDMVYAKVRYNF